MPYTVKVYENPDPYPEARREEVGEFLKGLLDYWVPMLRLDNWSIDCRVVRGEGLTYWAKVRAKPQFEDATVEVVNPHSDDEWDKDYDVKQHLEISIVHELLHLRYCIGHLNIYWDDNKKDAVYYKYEAATEITARALVAARHGKERILTTP